MFRSCLVVVALSVAGPALADWPAWRGPGGQGYTTETNLPLHWSATDNVKWKIPLEQPGNSTPVISGDRIFLTQANRGGSVRGIRCYAKADGKLLWKNDVDYAGKERNWNQDWYANASPVTDGKQVFACFASAGLFAYDLDGKELWKRTDLGKWDHVYGNGTSPVLYGDLVIQMIGPIEAQSSNDIMAFNKKTGETVWEVKNEVKQKGGCWGTPIIASVNGQDQLIVGLPHQLKGFDPKTGKELWFCDGLTYLVYTSPLYDKNKNIAVGMSGYGGAALAVKLGGSGDITKDRLWHHPRNTQRVGTGAIVGDHVYMLEETGIPHCYELESGKQVWEVEKRPQGSTWSSMLVSGNRLYVLTKQGDTLIFAASPKFELLGTNRLGEPTYSSIAVSNGELYIRTFKSLWCISDKK
jgi:outer membrane protein assembly factor BamB